ncbi:putative polysaccharide biosynthesis protein [Aureibacillus halotolerans]|uniref:O-antigen/teichoic acid export membrane protein n=1 Tax=Aureibacillus halotolerans TaxID=1508390 RepID=A0A4R6U3J3_9BACI|nr:polysaccharide biosynthesis protein [Aureibacillus halotolerans]TDQ39059.1 O-antigen/teichoic acid export membrane protein [Aureibacillus halotolerans]
MAVSRLLRGTFLLTSATFISKFLGMILVFPLNALLGEQGGALYSYAYIPYSIMLSIATMGVPLAVSKFISKYNTIGDYQTGRRLFRSGLKVMGLTGVISFLFLFIIAPWIAPFVVNEGSVHATSDVVNVIRLVSTALIIVPAMSLMRGFFQGHQSMGPSAVSTVIEQIIRVAFIVIGCSIALYWFQSDMQTAVGIATLAAFVGALGGLVTLVYFWKKRKDGLNEMLTQSKPHPKKPLDEVYRELLRYAIPFVFVGLAVPLFQLVDMFTFNTALAVSGFSGDTSGAFSAYTLYGHKLIMIPVSLATGFALTLIPTVTSAYVAKRTTDVHKYITQALQIIIFLIMPAALGLSILAKPAYAAFFGISDQFSVYASILGWYAPAALLFALFTITTSILQGVNRQRVAMLSLTIGFIVKCLLTYPLILVLQADGAPVATMLGFGFAVLFNFYAIHRTTGYPFKRLKRRSLLVFLMCLFMCLCVGIWSATLQVWLPIENNRWNAVVVLGTGVLIGALIYGLVALRTGYAEKVFGPGLMKKLRLRA